MMDDRQLQAIQAAAIYEFFNASRFQISAFFYSTTTLRNDISLRGKQIIIRVAEGLRPAPPEILRILAIILFAKLIRARTPATFNREYREYIRGNILPHLPTVKRRPSALYQSEGRNYNLAEIFDRLNGLYFENGLERPVLGWSLRKSYSRLGFYSYEKKLLVISRIFDSKQVPREVVGFLMYHEMLHIFIPAREVKGRRQIHSADFRELERRFPDYTRIQMWIRQYLSRPRFF
jgi:predicted metal-dependent hydrolase